MEKYNNGKPIVINNIPEEEKLRAIREFSEGSEALEHCLIVLNNLGIRTKACCRGQHLSYAKYYDSVSSNAEEEYPNVSWQSYVAFENDQDWQSYLSEDLINDENVIIDVNDISFLGRDNEEFFKRLQVAFLTGKKNNQELLARKNNEITNDMIVKSYIYSLIRIGFTREQMIPLVAIFIRHFEPKSREEAIALRNEEFKLLRESISELKKSGHMRKG